MSSYVRIITKRHIIGVVPKRYFIHSPVTIVFTSLKNKNVSAMANCTMYLRMKKKQQMYLYLYIVGSSLHNLVVSVHERLNELGSQVLLCAWLC